MKPHLWTPLRRIPHSKNTIIFVLWKRSIKTFYRQIGTIWSGGTNWPLPLAVNVILDLFNVLLLRLIFVQKTYCVACPGCLWRVLTKVCVGFLRCHFSCYLLAHRITFLSGITRSTGPAFAAAEGKLFLWWKAAKWPITHSPYLYTRPHGSEGMRAEGEKKTGLRINLITMFHFLVKPHPRASVAVYS